ncbi:Eco57I restriction-modification methylase domain-containing protein [Cytophagaceae bacterium DM2B3-1]|uniref:site-specific DNA-methyltransferase (adenine-specific) n=1 Tax=Xanthocytophaga flava TaxID=3048013 RepID=A0ABT7CEF4_9BACT|nr:Eco57I restriction-modification methylase domain-containing protein [Xanthocytophaga flavus]MDJ1472721.1 Eco57I restriction-modification methylase domain-containing protein [Xanthocytophaga flavus]MDJ1491901.1 Eco57I restriction-modification methylase domain-containing protein [Xanthocytophaga flavus]
MMTHSKKSLNNTFVNREEKPSEYADRLGIYYTSKVSSEHKKKLGQFFTPLAVAQFMASFSKIKTEKVKILDPGCGIGILSTAICEALISSNCHIRTIELVAFETDVDILPLAEDCFKYLGLWLNQRGIDFTFFLCKNDFVLHNSSSLNNNESVHESYDIIISNPPYFKLQKDDERILATKSVIYGQTNIYTIFLLIAAKLLKEDGQLIFITPRSFCSGNYFRLFREIFFSIVDLDTIHLFDSRKDTFKRDKVLQENIIISAVRKQHTRSSQLGLPFIDIDKDITISSSNGIDDIKDRRIKKYECSDLINFDSYQKIIHLPSSDTDEKVIEIFKTWTGSLSAYNLAISTGPVVDFRSEEMISFESKQDVVPLIWLHNVDSMKFTWPRNVGYKGKPKGQYIINNEVSSSRLVKNRNYVFLRRFSAKDDNRRLIAAPYFSNTLSDMPKLGIENHLNYIYHKEKDLSNNEAFGLAGILNSRLFDLYFRTFNGNINVSATELRDFPLPDFQLIQLLGEKIKKIIEIGVPLNIDSLISEIFNISIDLSQIYE